MSLKRILTAMLGLPLVILVFLLGNEYVIGGVVFVASIICMHEYFEAVKKVSKPIEWIGYLSNILIIWATICDEIKLYQIIIFAIPVMLALLFMCVIVTDMKITFKDVAYTLLGIVYIPFFLMFLELTRRMENGKILIGFCFVISWSTDVFAYLVGRNFGKHKFSKISPKKTVEGSIAGIVGAIIATMIYALLINKYFDIQYSNIFIIVMSGILSAVSQIGDFVASTIKRFVDIKDYGNLLPGHGGILDRIDSLLFIAPFTYMIFLL